MPKPKGKSDLGKVYSRWSPNNLYMSALHINFKKSWKTLNLTSRIVYKSAHLQLNQSVKNTRKHPLNHMDLKKVGSTSRKKTLLFTGLVICR